MPLLLVAVGCDAPEKATPGGGPDESPSARAHDIARLAHDLRVDATAVTDPVPPPAPPGDLAEEMAQFTTLEACVKEHASKDPLVADALGSLGYDGFLQDVCRTLEALHTKSTKPCARIDASGLRRACASQVAIVTGAPDMCPLRVEDAKGLGRDPTCLAVASGDVRLCGGETRERRARCEALATRDDGKCRALAGGRAGCERDVARWKSAIGAPPRKETPAKLGAKVSIASEDPAIDAGRTNVDLRSLAEHGVVLVGENAHAVSLQVGVTRETGAAALATSPEMGSRLAFTVLIAADGSATLRHLELELPNKLLVVPPLPFRGDVVVTRARTRGDAITITAHGKILAAPRAYDVEIEVETFILDGIDQDSIAPRATP